MEEIICVISEIEPQFCQYVIENLNNRVNIYEVGRGGDL